MNPTERIVWCRFDNLIRDSDARFPLSFSGANVPANGKNFGMIALRFGDFFKFRGSLGEVAEFEPALCGLGIVGIRRFELVHYSRCRVSLGKGMVK